MLFEIAHPGRSLVAERVPDFTPVVAVWLSELVVDLLGLLSPPAASGGGTTRHGPPPETLHGTIRHMFDTHSQAKRT
jgi:hypothetical protein